MNNIPRCAPYTFGDWHGLPEQPGVAQMWVGPYLATVQTTRAGDRWWVGRDGQLHAVLLDGEGAESRRDAKRAAHVLASMERANLEVLAEAQRLASADAETRIADAIKAQTDARTDAQRRLPGLQLRLLFWRIFGVVAVLWAIARWFGGGE